MRRSEGWVSSLHALVFERGRHRSARTAVMAVLLVTVSTEYCEGPRLLKAMQSQDQGGTYEVYKCFPGIPEVLHRLLE